MRYRDLIPESPAAERICKANERRHDAMASYQEEMRTIAATAPADRKGERQQRAREKGQSKLSAADTALRSAIKDAQ